METIHKAEKILRNYMNVTVTNEHARQLALIAVDELLWALNDIDGEVNMSNYIDWWEEVREDIVNYYF